MQRTGFHLGLAGGYEKAVAYARELGCTTAQIFTHSPRSFQFKDLDHGALTLLKAAWKENGIHPIFSHGNYLINLGSSENKAFYASLGTVKRELEYARAFGCDYFVLHVGKHKEAGLDAGMRQVAKAVNKLREDILRHKVMILLETVAGAGTEIGAKFAELGMLIRMIDAELQPYIGVAVDTCHIFAAGYDIRTKEGVERTIKEMDDAFGTSSVKLIHVNDSKGECGGHLDRHEHIGQGKIGLEGLRLFLNHPKIRGIPMILETPVDENGDDRSDLAALNRIVGKSS